MLVHCKKCKRGIIVKLVGENMLILLKRKTDYNPIKQVTYGKDYQVTINCTLCGEPQFIECVDGKITKDNLILKEDTNGEEPEAKQDDDGSAESGGSEPSSTSAGEQPDGNPESGSGEGGKPKEPEEPKGSAGSTGEPGAKE